MHSDEPLRPRIDAPRIVPEMVTFELTSADVRRLGALLRALTDRHSRVEPTELVASLARKMLSQIPGSAL